MKYTMNEIVKLL